MIHIDANRCPTWGFGPGPLFSGCRCDLPWCQCVSTPQYEELQMSDGTAEYVLVGNQIDASRCTVHGGEEVVVSTNSTVVLRAAGRGFVSYIERPPREPAAIEERRVVAAPVPEPPAPGERKIRL